jgi:hypothetical protein
VMRCSYCCDLLFTASIAHPQDPQRIEKARWVGTRHPEKGTDVTEVFDETSVTRRTPSSQGRTKIEKVCI